METIEVIKDENGNIDIEHYQDEGYIILEQPGCALNRKDRVYVSCKNIKKLVTILKKIK